MYIVIYLSSQFNPVEIISISYPFAYYNSPTNYTLEKVENNTVNPIDQEVTELLSNWIDEARVEEQVIFISFCLLYFICNIYEENALKTSKTN